MRRWIMAVAGLLIAASLAALALLPSLARPHASVRSSRTAAMGLVLLEDEDGLYVLAVQDGSRAGSAGIQPGDRLTAAWNTALETVEQLEALLAKQEAGSPLPLTLARQDQTMTVDLAAP